MAARCAGWCATTPRPALTAWSCGSTGEAAALDDAEQLAVLDAVLNVADGLPVMMGLAGNHQGHVRACRPSARGRWRASWRPRRTTCGPDRPARPPISVAWPTPRASLALYDIPYRTGAALDTATLLELAAHRTSPPSRTAAARWKRPWR